MNSHHFTNPLKQFHHPLMPVPSTWQLQLVTNGGCLSIAACKATDQKHQSHLCYEERVGSVSWYESCIRWLESQRNQSPSFIILHPPVQTINVSCLDLWVLYSLNILEPILGPISTWSKERYLWEESPRLLGAGPACRQKNESWIWYISGNSLTESQTQTNQETIDSLCEHSISDLNNRRL